MIVHSDNLSIEQIADSGQCFRMNKMDKDRYRLVAYGRYLEITQVDDVTVDFHCSEEEFQEVWQDYFDLAYDYKRIVDQLINSSDEFLRKAAEYGRGIRILRQEPFEALISFIISQNKNIPAIKSCIEAICRQYGKRKISKGSDQFEYYTFPTPEVLAEAKLEDLRKCKTGYRDKYIICAAQAVASRSLDLNHLINCTHEETVGRLREIHGIGAKVADCISLYGLHHIEAFPVDVWIKRVLKEIYQDNFDLEQYQGYAGIVQQYMFYYIRFMQG